MRLILGFFVVISMSYPCFAKSNFSLCFDVKGNNPTAYFNLDWDPYGEFPVNYRNPHLSKAKQDRQIEIKKAFRRMVERIETSVLIPPGAPIDYGVGKSTLELRRDFVKRGGNYKGSLESLWEELYYKDFVFYRSQSPEFEVPKHVADRDEFLQLMFENRVVSDQIIGNTFLERPGSLQNVVREGRLKDELKVMINVPANLKHNRLKIFRELFPDFILVGNSFATGWKSPHSKVEHLFFRRLFVTIEK
jgi:hypothetical protein